MGMTRLERGTRAALAKYLREQGYVTYARLLLGMELNFHHPNYPFAAMIDADKGIIYINPKIDDKEDLSVIIRHEILHHYLAHQERVLKHYAKQRGLEWSDIKDIPLEDLVNMDEDDFAKLADSLGDDVRDKAYTNRKIARGLYIDSANSVPGGPYHNIIKDAEIATRGYTKADERVVKGLVIEGMPFPGIVTDQDFPQWSRMSVEQIMDQVEEQLKKEKERAEKLKGIITGMFNPMDGSFFDMQNNVIYKG